MESYMLLVALAPPKIPPPNYVLVVVHIIGRRAARVFWPGRVSGKVCDVVVILVSLKRVRTGVSKGKIGGSNELGPFAPLRSSRSCRGSQEGGRVERGRLVLCARLGCSAGKGVRGGATHSTTGVAALSWRRVLG